MHRLTAVLCLLLAVSGGVAAADKKLSIALAYSAFRPSSATARDIYGSPWTGLSIAPFTRHRSDQWRPTFDVTFYHHDHLGEVRLIPVTFGVQRAFGGSGTAIPYVAVRAGPYYGWVKSPLGERDSRIGLGANAAIGVTIKQRFFVEARYDYFGRISGSRFDGLSLTTGVRVFDIGR
jgi:hypothetical protein